MKKLGSIFLICFFLLLFCGCSNNSDNWQTVQLESNKSILIPSDWVVTKVDEFIYFSDKSLEEQDAMIYMFQSNSRGGDYSDLQWMAYEEIIGKEEKNIVCNSFRELYVMTSAGVSTGPIYGTSITSVDSKKQTMLYLDLDSELEYKFFVWGNNVNAELLKKIANTYYDG